MLSTRTLRVLRIAPLALLFFARRASADEPAATEMRVASVALVGVGAASLVGADAVLRHADDGKTIGDGVARAGEGGALLVTGSLLGGIGATLFGASFTERPRGGAWTASGSAALALGLVGVCAGATQIGRDHREGEAVASIAGGTFLMGAGSAAIALGASSRHDRPMVSGFASPQASGVALSGSF